MMIHRARRSPFTGLPLREVKPQKDKHLCHRKMQEEGYTSAVVDCEGQIMRLYRHDPNGITASIGAEHMNMTAAFALMTDGTEAAYLRDHDEHVEDTVQAMMLDAMRTTK